MARALSNIVYLESPEKGVDGRGILSGARDPLMTDGRLGDFWINTASKHLFGPKNAGEWPDKGLIRGAQGWAPKLVAEADGVRRVFKIDDWTGGEGTKPGTGYLAADGTVVPDIEDAADFRGEQGPEALIDALDAKTDAVTYDTLMAMAESAGDNEKAALKRLFEAGANMPFVSKAAAAAGNIPAAVKTVRTQFYAPNFAVPATLVGGAKYRRVNQEPTHGLKFRSLDRWTAEGDHDSANGGWWEIDEDRITPQMAGAIGDGTTDATSAVQAWVDACAGREGFVPAGRYRLSGVTGGACVTLPEVGIAIRGAGRDRCVFETIGPNAVFAATDANNIDIDGVGFDGGQTVARLGWSRAVVLRGCVGVRIHACRFTRFGEGVILVGKQGFGGSDAIPDGTRQTEVMHITNNLIEDCWGTVAIVSKYVGMRETVIAGNIISNSCTGGIAVESEDSDVSEWAEAVIVQGNIVIGCSAAKASGFSNVACGIGINERARRVVCAGNIVIGVDGITLSQGIMVGTSPAQSDTPATEIIVGNNITRNVTASGGEGHGVAVTLGDADVSIITIIGNQVVDVQTGGIVFDVASGSATSGTLKSTTVVGNNVARCSIGIDHKITGGSGELAIEDAVISDNVVCDCVSHGMLLRARNATISGNLSTRNGGTGITLLSGSSDNTVCNNRCEANGGTGILSNGARTDLIGNSCNNNGTSGGTSYGIYHQSGAGAQIVHNRCGDSQGSPTQDYGIRGVGGETVRGNEVIGNAIGGIWGGIGAYNTGTYDSGLNRTA